LSFAANAGALGAESVIDEMLDAKRGEKGFQIAPAAVRG
jgi:hypothetical protein